MFPQSGSVFIFMPPIPIAQNEHLGIAGPPVDLEDAGRRVHGQARTALACLCACVCELLFN